jgi:HKD family nuclease
VIVRCDDIGGIVDHPSLFKLPFQYQAIIQKIIQMKYNTKTTTTKLTKALKLENIELTLIQCEWKIYS